LLAVFAGGLIVYGVRRVDMALKIGENELEARKLCPPPPPLPHSNGGRFYRKFWTKQLIAYF